MAKIRGNYSDEALQSAIRQVKSGFSIVEAAKNHNIPKSTLSKKLRQNENGKWQLFILTTLVYVFKLFSFSVLKKPGVAPYLYEEQEKELETWIVEGAKFGNPKTSNQIRYAAWGLSSNKSRKGFTQKGPSAGWFTSYKGRKPLISKRKKEKLSKASASVTEVNIKMWFETVTDWVVTNKYEDILRDPSRIYNCDEAGFQLAPSGNYVYAEKGMKDCHEVLNSDKGQLTALWTFCATGEILKPHLIYPGKRLNKNIQASIPDSCTYGQTESGWMTSEEFQRWLQHSFVPRLRTNGIKFPVILFTDGHASHCGFEVGNLF